jgi:hypothetical protein
VQHRERRRLARVSRWDRPKYLELRRIKVGRHILTDTDLDCLLAVGGWSGNKRAAILRHHGFYFSLLLPPGLGYRD